MAITEYFKNPNNSVARVDTDEREGDFIAVSVIGTLHEDAIPSDENEYDAYIASLED